jgi:hypothetical protein
MVENRTYELLKSHFENGKTLIMIDSSKEGVVLPTNLMDTKRVKLSFKNGLKDFDLNESKAEIKVCLSFKGEPFSCTIPFDSIYYVAMADEVLDGDFIRENAPIEILNDLQEFEDLLKFFEEFEDMIKLFDDQDAFIETLERLLMDQLSVQ